MNTQSTITRAEIIALAKEREAQVAFATREFIREHKAEPVKSHPSFVKGWANVTFCGVETALIVGRLAKWAGCFDPAEVFAVETTAENITITAQSVKSSVKLAVRQTVAESTDCPALRRSQKTAERDQLGAPIVITADFGACTVAKGRDAKAEKAELKKAKAKLPAMEAMAKLQRNAKEAIRLREIASGSFSDALAFAKRHRDALRELHKTAIASYNIPSALSCLLGIDAHTARRDSFSRARVNLRKWPAIKARLSAEYIALLSAWRAEYPEPAASAASVEPAASVASVASVEPAASVATTPATVAPVVADTVVPSVPASEVKTATATATLRFASYESAKLFCRDWSRVTLRGYDMSAKDANGGASVTLYKVGEDDRQWIDARIASEQNTPPPSVPASEKGKAHEKRRAAHCPYTGEKRMMTEDELPIGWKFGQYQSPPSMPVLETKNEPLPTIAAGQTLTARSVGDWDCIFSVEILERKGQFVRVKAEGTEKRVKVFTDERGEFIYALGRYSMAPIFRAPSVAICKAETAIAEPATPPRHESQPIEEKPRRRERRTRKAHPRPSLSMRHTRRASALLWRFTLRDAIAHRASWQCAPPRGIPDAVLPKENRTPSV